VGVVDAIAPGGLTPVGPPVVSAVPVGAGAAAVVVAGRFAQPASTTANVNSATTVT
jgi:hypothetical protein